MKELTIDNPMTAALAVIAIVLACAIALQEVFDGKRGGTHGS